MQSELTEKEKGLMGEKQFIDSQKQELSAFQENLTSEKETLLSKYQSLTQEKESLDGEKLTLGKWLYLFYFTFLCLFWELICRAGDKLNTLHLKWYFPSRKKSFRVPYFFQ